MWPLKRKTPSLEEVKLEGDHITLIHTQGANRFSKDEILAYSYESDLFSSSLEVNYSHINKILFFILLGGFWNMLFTFFPVFVWENDQIPKVYSEVWFSPDIKGWFILHNVIILGLAILFTYALYLLVLYIIKIYRLKNCKDKYIKDILCISLNNVQIKIVYNSYYFPDELKLMFKKTPDDDIEKTDFIKFLLKNWQPTVFFILLTVTLFIFNYNVPFWYYQVFENPILSINSKDLFSEDEFLFWKYYGTWNDSGIIHLTNPFIAFFHGILSNCIFLLIITILTGVLFILLALGCAFIFLPGSILLYVFWDLLTKKTKLIKYYDDIIIARWIFGIFGLFISLGIFYLLLEFSISNNWTNFNNITGNEEKVNYAKKIMFLIAVFYSFFNVIVILTFAAFKVNILFPFLLEGVEGDRRRAKEYRRNKEALLDKIKQDPTVLKKAGIFKDDKDVVMEAVVQSGSLLEYASDEMKNDKEIVKAAIRENYLAFEFASEDLRNDPEIQEVYLSIKKAY
jgi:hypothetical protein